MDSHLVALAAVNPKPVFDNWGMRFNTQLSYTQQIKKLLGFRILHISALFSEINWFL